MSSTPRITFHPFADGAALHREGSHRLWVLNHSSAVLWCLLEEHGPGERLVKAYAEHFDIPADQARIDVQVALAEFRRNGLFGGEESPQSSAVSSQLPVTIHQSQVASHQSQGIVQWHQTYTVVGVSWRIACSEPAAAESWFDCLGHLVTSSADDVDIEFSVGREDGFWALNGAGAQIEDLADDQVLPWLLTLLFGELCHRQPQSLLLHAAVACRDGRLLLLPGESTFGKSTLAATLAASGWMLFSDELAPLDPTTLQVAPFPLPVGIKHRSLQALAGCYPKLAARPVHRRADGQLVRYLAPPQIDLAGPNEAPATVTALLFPRFRPEAAATTLQRIAPLPALDLLARTGSSERPLDTRDVQALLTLAGERPCWSLEYSDLVQAVREIDKLKL